MISTRMNKQINEQINKEIYSAYLYMSMAAYVISEGLNGMESWLKVQTLEEMAHAQKFYDYVNQQGGRVELKAIDSPPKDFKSPLHIFQETLAHEKLVTASINELVDLAKKEKDFATDAFLQWFVTEQVEEEASASEILQKLKIVGKDGNGLLSIDNQLGTRTFVPPAAAA